MNELIKIENREDGTQAVSARELHEVLESKQQFSDWIKNRIDKYGFAEGVDYQAIHNFMKCQNGIGGTVRIEYALTINAAKELAMVEGNEKGKQVRKYFIECETKLKNNYSDISKIVSNPDFAIKVLTALKEEREEKERLQIESNEMKKEVKILTPKGEYFDKVLQSTSTYTTEQIAKELGMSAISLNKLLERIRVQFKRSGTWFLMSDFQTKGYTKMRTHYFHQSDGSGRTNSYTVWTEKGREFIHSIVVKVKE